MAEVKMIIVHHCISGNEVGNRVIPINLIYAKNSRHELGTTTNPFLPEDFELPLRNQTDPCLLYCLSLLQPCMPQLLVSVLPELLDTEQNYWFCA